MRKSKRKRGTFRIGVTLSAVALAAALGCLPFTGESTVLAAEASPPRVEYAYQAGSGAEAEPAGQFVTGASVDESTTSEVTDATKHLNLSDSSDVTNTDTSETKSASTDKADTGTEATQQSSPKTGVAKPLQMVLALGLVWILIEVVQKEEKDTEDDLQEDEGWWHHTKHL